MTHPTTYPTRFVRAEQARRDFGERADRLGEALWRGDPLADAVIADLESKALVGGWRSIERALKEGVHHVPEATEALHALFEEVERVPLWADFEAINEGGELLYRGGAFSGMVLGFKSLIYGYCAPGGNKPLVFSGRLYEGAPRRLFETTSFVHRVCTEGGLSRGAPGYCAAVKVRLMHAKVRTLLGRDPRWQAEDWGTPINQHDMMATLFLFSVLLMRGLRMVGFDISARESERYMLLWRYVGYLMGVEEAMLPTTEDQAYALAQIIEATQEPPDEDARQLTMALFSSAERAATTEEERARARRLTPFYQGLSRALLGEEIADHLALPNGRWKHIIPMIRHTVSRMERVRVKVPALRQRQVNAGHRHWNQVLELGAKGQPVVTFTPPESLALSL